MGCLGTALKTAAAVLNTYLENDYLLDELN